MGYPLKAASLPARVLVGDIYNDYLNNALVQNYVTNTARCHWIRVWLTWSDIDPTPVPSDLYQQWSRYHDGTSPGTGYFVQYLDTLVATCNRLGIGVLLSMNHYSAPWANGASAPEPGTGKSAFARFPAHIDLGSPWERFLSYVYNRYRINFNTGTGYYNPSGPNSSNFFGNPQQAWIAGLGIVNEPNYEHWQDFNAGCTAATMMQTMESAVFFWNQYAATTACALFAPDLSDTPDVFRNSVRYATDYLDTTNAILNMLSNWRPRVYFVWSHHNYTDIREQVQTRANNVRNALYNLNWRGGGDRNVYITEGAASAGTFSSADQNAQVVNLNKNWNDPHFPELQMFTQHSIRNKPLPGGGHESIGFTDTNDNPLAEFGPFAALTPRR
jgi:hypothetical protein